MQEHANRNRNLAFLSTFIIVLYGLLYVSTFRDLITLWLSNEDYGHGSFVVPVCLYLVWRRRRDIAAAADRPSRWWPALTASWAVLYSIGTIGHITTVTNLSMIVFPVAATATLMSATAAKIIAWPVLFTAFMFPIPSEIYTRITNPQHNAFLLAPLAKQAGGTQQCGRAVFANTQDTDYQKILRTFQPIHDLLGKRPRADMPGFTVMRDKP